VKKKKILKPAPKTTKPAAKAVTPVPKMKLRTTSAKASAKAAATATRNGKLPCICGCGELTASFLKRGHFKRVLGFLRDIRAGEIKPEKAFGSKQLAAAYGPWVTLKSRGMKAGTTDYAKVRANLNG